MAGDLPYKLFFMLGRDKTSIFFDGLSCDINSCHNGTVRSPFFWDELAMPNNPPLNLSEITFAEVAEVKIQSESTKEAFSLEIPSCNVQLANIANWVISLCLVFIFLYRRDIVNVMKLMVLPQNV